MPVDIEMTDALQVGSIGLCVLVYFISYFCHRESTVNSDMMAPRRKVQRKLVHSLVINW